MSLEHRKLLGGSGRKEDYVATVAERWRIVMGGL